MNTLYLNPQTWDLVLDVDGNIAIATDPYSVAQDVASAIKTFLGEVWYDTTQGVPYFQNILGQLPSTALLSAYIQNAALSVPTVASATCTFTDLTDRKISGVVTFTTDDGVTQSVTF
jgi:hypothetical protein